MNRDLAVGIYLASAAVAGAILAVPHQSSAVSISVIVFLGIGATVYRIRVLHETSWSRHEIEWLVVFGVAWIVVAVLTWPGLL